MTSIGMLYGGISISAVRLVLGTLLVVFGVYLANRKRSLKGIMVPKT